MDPEENRNPQQYHLYLNERRYLLHEGTGSQTPGQIRTQITTDRLPKLPDRIQHLLDDVALLSSRDFLTAAVWPEGWDQLRDLKIRDELTDSPVWLPQTNLTGFTKLGFLFGRFGRALTKDVAPTYNAADFQWGFLLGTVGRPQGEYRHEHREIERVLGQLGNRFATRKAAIEDQKAQTEKRRLESDTEYSGPSPTLYSGTAFREYIEQGIEERQNIKQSPEPVESEFFGFLNAVIEAPAETIPEIVALAERLRRSVSEVTTTRWRKIPAKDPLQSLHTADGEMKSSEMATECGTDKRIVSYLMELLAGEKDDQIWSDNPLVIETTEGRRGRNWKLTSFGELVAHSLFDEEGIEGVQKALVKHLIDESPDNNYSELINRNLSDDVDRS